MAKKLTISDLELKKSSKIATTACTGCIFNIPSKKHNCNTKHHLYQEAMNHFASCYTYVYKIIKRKSN